MSWKVWEERGFGFKTHKISAIVLYHFMKDHRTSLCAEHADLLDELQEKIAEGNLTVETLDLSEHFTGRTNTVGTIIAGVMSSETGLRFDPVGIDDKGEEAVYFYACYPWQLNDKEKSLTREQMGKICRKYAKELGLPSDRCVGELSMVFSC